MPLIVKALFMLAKTKNCAGDRPKCRMRIDW
jgi:hypothetical protein